MIDISDLKYSFSSSTIKKGRGYLERVQSIDVDFFNDFIEVQSTVSGSSFKPYSVHINIHNKFKKIRSFCSCPVGNNCKHAAATMLIVIRENLLEELTEEEKRQLLFQQWVDSLKKPVNDDHQQKSFLIYELDPYASEHAGVHVQVKLVKPLKKGGYSQGKTLRSEQIQHGFSKYPLQGEDEQILSMLSGFYNKDSYYYGYGKVNAPTGKMGATLLTMMVNSGRLYFGSDHRVPVSFGDDILYEFAWKEVGDEPLLQLELLSDSLDKRNIIFTTPYYAMDIKRKEIRRVEGIKEDYQTLKGLLQAPVISNDEAMMVSKTLLESFPNSDLPLPLEESLHSFGLETLTYQLIINSDDMQLQYKYGDHTIAISDQRNQRVIAHDQIVQIERDLEKEEQAKNQLIQLGAHVKQVVSDGLLFTFSYDNQHDYIEQWHRFMTHSVSTLRDQGWEVIVNKKTITVDYVEQVQTDVEEHHSWFDLAFDIVIDGKSYNSIPIITDLIASVDSIEELPSILYLKIDDAHYAKVDKSIVLPMVQTLFELFNTNHIYEEKIRIHTYDAELLDSVGRMKFDGAEKMEELARKLKTFGGIDKPELPVGLKASLRNYQYDGYAWLQFLREFGFSGILADDMGLGKTVQTLAHLLQEKLSGRTTAPTLIVAPTSLMGNWRDEIEKFTPELSVLVLQGDERKTKFDQINEYDIVLSTYPLISRDFDHLNAYSYYYIILDEAQNIKNHRAKSAQLLRQLVTQHRLCLTGTPMENHLGELWGLFDFLMPGFLFDQRFFNEELRSPIEKEGNTTLRQHLNDRIRPFLLRRTKQDVILELPPKTEIIHKVTLGNKQAKLYESIRVAMDKKVRDVIKEKGVKRSHIMILDALLKLRQVCCDPRLVKLEQAKTVHESTKFDALLELLEELHEEGRKILLFSQFTQMLGLIETALKEKNFAYTKLTGQTRKREEAIAKFKRGEVSIFLISLKAGGVGLNLTEADSIIHYDPWWNPAVENQATDRAYRIGQDKPVFVYKLIAENSVEEKILALQKKKQALADSVYENKDGVMGLTQEDLQELFK